MMILLQHWIFLIDYKRLEIFFKNLIKGETIASLKKNVAFNLFKTYNYNFPITP